MNKRLAAGLLIGILIGAAGTLGVFAYKVIEVEIK